MNGDDRLKSAMARLAAEIEPAEPPDSIEPALLAEFERARRRRTIEWTLRAAAIAAGVALVIFAFRQPAEQPAPVAAVEDVAPAEEAPFVPIPYVAQPGPYERAEVVRMNLSVAALISAGFPMRTPDAAARVEADVLVGQDGRARAVRLISVSSYN